MREKRNTKPDKLHKGNSNNQRGDISIISISCGRLVDFARYNANHIFRDLNASKEALDDGPGFLLQTPAGLADRAYGVLELSHVGGDSPL